MRLFHFPRFWQRILLCALLLLNYLSSTSASEITWPRTFVTPMGAVTLQQPPQRIVSTSVTLTGSLLAINAPLVGSGATARNSTVADDQGFFIQWSQVAQSNGLKPLFIGEADAETIIAEAPDLVIISASGGDSALKLYPQLSTIVPTVVIDYSDSSWQELTQRLSEITGHETDAKTVITRFEQRVKSLKQRLKLPPQPTSALVYYEDGRGINLWTGASAQGQLLRELGFSLAPIPADMNNKISMGKRKDIIQFSGETMADAISGESVMLFSANEQTAEKFAANPFLSHLDAIRHKRIYAMGMDTFRLDYYSANNLLDHIERLFADTVPPSLE